MKICFIGNSGHSMQAFSELQDWPEAEFCGMAPGSPEETVSPLWSNHMPVFGCYHQMLDSIHPDLAVVSPIFGLTGSVIIECAAHGIDVFAEKPVAASLEELDQVRKAVLTSGIRFCAMHYLRYTPSFYRAKELVAAGEIGEIRMITAQKSYRYGVRPEWYHDDHLYPGTIPWVGIHAIDWIYFFTGKPFRSVKALQWGKPAMAALCQFELESGIPAGANIDFLRPAKAPTHGDDRVRIAGTTGVLEVWEDHLLLMNEKGAAIEKPQTAPRLTRMFAEGKQPIDPEEIFMLTGVSLLARDSALAGRCLSVPDFQNHL